jgi:hypothetical protein
MARRTGTSNLPLHTGRAPKWLFDRMTQLAPAIVEAIVVDYGPAEVLRRLSDPYWFQAFGCVLGFDWHSSGVTTTVTGAVKEGIRGLEKDLGFFAGGGKGAVSRNTPAELVAFGEKLGLDGDRLAYTSRITAKVDSAAVQDGYQLYHHTFLLTEHGEWAVVQQGMRDADGTARRYHWLGESVSDFVDEPHAGIAAAAPAQLVLDLTASDSAPSRSVATQLAQEAPARVEGEVARLLSLDMPRRHWVDVKADIQPRNLHKVLLTTYEAQPQDFESLLMLPGVGARALRALTLIGELVHGATPSTRDPARYSFAHGGKDGHPFPVDRRSYDRSIDWLRGALDRARIGHSDRLHALRRLDALATPDRAPAP